MSAPPLIPRCARNKLLKLLLLAFLAMSCATTRDLTVDEKIGQLFAPDAYGVYMNESSWAYKRLDHFVREQHVGGFVWFSANVYEMALLNKRLQAASRVPLLISADLE